jgi:2-amino-4-hydroxy-6-hydroxymethyldihydropteridine diphosphokinase
MVEALIALGSNVGDSSGFLNLALEQLRETPGLVVACVSSFIRTATIGPIQQQPDFINAVALVRTSLSPFALLERLKAIEVAVGRVQRERWGPREIDLDILTYGNEKVDHPQLQIPHPELHNRPFLLDLIAEIQACPTKK